MGARTLLFEIRYPGPQTVRVWTTSMLCPGPQSANTLGKKLHFVPFPSSRLSASQKALLREGAQKM
ncbi:Hypothetical predicted protein [Marmota monax]|uniref:Uncharacterized protein n=1 Tax=Marmota monax TaxID=9995 RepID=A0A5E4ANU5_MARMO|nr:hypothetical protein GHT09_004579 [Marmota monax]VTJ58349.1 Hypothetical predicted protein [Marmota monax]